MRLLKLEPASLRFVVPRPAAAPDADWELTLYWPKRYDTCPDGESAWIQPASGSVGRPRELAGPGVDEIFVATPLPSTEWKLKPPGGSGPFPLGVGPVASTIARRALSYL